MKHKHIVVAAKFDYVRGASYVDYLVLYKLILSSGPCIYFYFFMLKFYYYYFLSQQFISSYFPLSFMFF